MPNGFSTLGTVAKGEANNTLFAGIKYYWDTVGRTISVLVFNMT